MFRISIYSIENHKKRQIIFILLSLVLLLPATNCLSQKRTVKQALSGFHTPSIILMYPEFIFKKNANTKEIKGIQSMNDNSRDSALYYNSKFIQYLDDSAFLSAYVGNLKTELEEYGCKVYNEDQLDTFLTLKETAYVFSAAQIEVEENIDPVVEEAVYDDTLSYYKNFSLQIVRLNSWFELSKLNADTARPKVLFSSFFIEDRLKGRFWRHPLMMDVKYRYILNEVKLEDIYGLAEYAGKKNASYLFDYLFNSYYSERYPEGMSQHKYWHYNKLTQDLREAGDSKFIILDDPESQ